MPRIPACLPPDWGDGYENVFLQFSCENQRAFDERWPIFKEIPAKHKGMNLAPLIGLVDITPALESGQIDWVFLGGKGFGGRRPYHYEWIKKVSDDCAKYRVNFTVNSIGAVFVKDGRTFFLDGQDLQARQAFLSRLSHYYRPVHFCLRSPYD